MIISSTQFIHTSFISFIWISTKEHILIPPFLFLFYSPYLISDPTDWQYLIFKIYRVDRKKAFPLPVFLVLSIFYWNLTISCHVIFNNLSVIWSTSLSKNLKNFYPQSLQTLLILIIILSCFILKPNLIIVFFSNKNVSSFLSFLHVLK